MSGPLQPGQVVCGYRIERSLGQGGMGAVYEASEPTIGRRVALKVLAAELGEDPQYVERFRREAEAAASLMHPHIVQVTGFVNEPGQPVLIVMEMLSGVSLLEALRSGPLAPERAWSITLALASALSAAHQRGIVHRDLKPANVFLVPLPGGAELVKLLDFGIAKLRESDGYARLTQTGVLIGTPRFASPEQALGARDVDARSDVFSLGVLLYGMLSGRPPFRGHGAELLIEITDREPTPLTTLAPTASPALIAVAERAMKKAREERFETAAAMGAALEAIETRTIEARESNPFATQAPARSPVTPTPISASPATAFPSTSQPTSHPSPQSAAAAIGQPPTVGAPIGRAPMARTAHLPQGRHPGAAPMAPEPTHYVARPAPGGRRGLLIGMFGGLAVMTLIGALGLGYVLFGRSGDHDVAMVAQGGASAYGAGVWRPTLPAERLGYQCMEYERRACQCTPDEAVCRTAVDSNIRAVFGGEHRTMRDDRRCIDGANALLDCPHGFASDDVARTAARLGPECVYMLSACECLGGVRNLDCLTAQLLIGPSYEALLDPDHTRQICREHEGSVATLCAP